MQHKTKMYGKIFPNVVTVGENTYSGRVSLKIRGTYYTGGPRTYQIGVLPFCKVPQI
jgi:hypothetical protein